METATLSSAEVERLDIWQRQIHRAALRPRRRPGETPGDFCHRANSYIRSLRSCWWVLVL